MSLLGSRGKGMAWSGVMVRLKCCGNVRGCLVCIFKQPFLVFKQYFTHFSALFHPHVFPQMFSNNNFQFLNTCTKRALSMFKWLCNVSNLIISCLVHKIP